MAATLCAGALTAWTTRTEGPALRIDGPLTTASPSTRPLPTPGVTPTPVTTPTPSQSAASRLGGIPSRVTITRLGVRMSVRPVGVDAAGRMDIPAEIGVAGWYRHGPRPGADAGAAVIAAHVDTAEDGAGPFGRLRAARVGDVIEVTTSQGALTYEVTSAARIPKARLDLDAVFTRTGPGALHLLTCGGEFDRSTGHYEDNIVVVASIRGS